MDVAHADPGEFGHGAARFELRRGLDEVVAEEPELELHFAIRGFDLADFAPELVAPRAEDADAEGGRLREQDPGHLVGQVGMA